jgi:hypothetical protein
MRHFLETTLGDPPAAQHIRQEGPNVWRSLRTAKGDHQHCVEGLGHVLDRLYWLVCPCLWPSARSRYRVILAAFFAGAALAVVATGLLYSWFSHEKNPRH